MLLDYQGKFNNILDEPKNNLNELKTEFCKLESDLLISRNVNDKLTAKLVLLEQNCHAKEQYSRREASKDRAFLLRWEIKASNKSTDVLDAIDGLVN